MCDVTGCEEADARSLPRKKVEDILALKTKSRRVHLCKAHYKEYKKETRQERLTERLGWK